MQNEVYNRALFRRKSEAARQKLREMGGVDGNRPTGIMASSPELMAAVAPPPVMAPQVTGPRPSMQAPQMRQPEPGMAPRPLPNIVPGMFPTPPAQQPYQTAPAPQAPALMPPQAPMPPQPQAPVQQQPQAPVQQRPVGFAKGGMTDLQPLGEMTGEFAVDVTAAPTAAPAATKQPVTIASVYEALRAKHGDDPEAMKKIDALKNDLTDPKVPDAKKAGAVADAITGETTKEGKATALEQMTGKAPSPEATVDQLNQQIAQVALGGAIGGPGSVAERISNGLLIGLKAQRDTAVTREDRAAAMALAKARAAGSKPAATKGWLDTQQGKNAYDLYEKYMATGNYSHQAAIAALNQLGQNLGTQLEMAMGAGAAAPGPSAASSGLTNLMQNAEGVTIGWDGKQWVDAKTGQPYAQ